MPTGTCFVVMGFGKKTDFETGRTLDLDKTYRNVIKPGVIASGLQCVRADEIVHSGLIDTPMYDQLLKADVVIADLSTSNKNAFYELGVRHALRPETTIVIAEDGMKTPPFDVNHIVIRQYHHLGEDIGFDEAMRFQAVLKDAIIDIMAKVPQERFDSPVYEFIKDLAPPKIAVTRGPAAAAIASPLAAADGSDETHSSLMKQVDDAFNAGDFATAKTLLAAIRSMRRAVSPDRPVDPYLVQRHALATYKSAQPDKVTAFKDAQQLLALLQPETSNDPETLGLWGAVHKGLWTATKERDFLDVAVRAYERGFYLRNDYYNGINYAYLLNERAAVATDQGEAIADFVQARRVRREVLFICKDWQKANPPPEAAAAPEAVAKFKTDQYWVLATIAEAQVGLEEGALGEQRLNEALLAAPQPWMRQATKDQVDKLKLLLAASPLKQLPVVAVQQ
ncbi:MAG TPA: TRAFs-binding domain-containing protein [Chthoniobacterales bacterium]